MGLWATCYLVFKLLYLPNSVWNYSYCWMLKNMLFIRRVYFLFSKCNLFLHNIQQKTHPISLFQAIGPADDSRLSLGLYLPFKHLCWYIIPFNESLYRLSQREARLVTISYTCWTHIHPYWHAWCLKLWSSAHCISFVVFWGQAFGFWISFSTPKYHTQGANKEAFLRERLRLCKQFLFLFKCTRKQGLGSFYIILRNNETPKKVF